MTAEECKAYYEQNKDFRAYVDGFVRNKKIIMDDGIFAFKMIQNTAEYYKAKEGKE